MKDPKWGSESVIIMADTVCVLNSLWFCKVCSLPNFVGYLLIPSGRPRGNWNSRASHICPSRASLKTPDPSQFIPASTQNKYYPFLCVPWHENVWKVLVLWTECLYPSPKFICRSHTSNVVVIAPCLQLYSNHHVKYPYSLISQYGIVVKFYGL